MDTGASTYPESKHDDVDIDADDADDIVIEESTVKLTKFTKIVAPIFLVFGLFSLVGIILSIAEVGDDDGWTYFMLVLLGTVVFSILAALVRFLLDLLSEINS